MTTEKLTYWTAVAVMAIVMGNPFLNHVRQMAETIGGKATPRVLAEIGSHSSAQALLLSRELLNFAPRNERVQARVALLEEKLSAREARFACVQAQRARAAAFAEMPRRHAPLVEVRYPQN